MTENRNWYAHNINSTIQLPSFTVPDPLENSFPNPVPLLLGTVNHDEAGVVQNNQPPRNFNAFSIKDRDQMLQQDD